MIETLTVWVQWGMIAAAVGAAIGFVILAFRGDWKTPGTWAGLALFLAITVGGVMIALRPERFTGLITL